MSEPSLSTPSHFIRQIIANDNKNNKWQGEVVTRFPPEPNGYLHIGHAKSIALNFAMANENGGRCHLRFDDTNPEKESVEYENSIKEMVQWLGYDWGTHIYYASDYFDLLYRCAELLINKGLAYVDSQSAEDMRAGRGNLTEAGKPSPYRTRTIEENLSLFRDMKAGKFAEGAHILRAKIDMASPNMNLRDPALYRIRHVHHHRTGDAWCIYPMYDFAHSLSDGKEGITHSLCSLEFEDHRPLYDWCLDNCRELVPHHSQQIEFARLNLSYTVMSKRKLLALVTQGLVDGWDDPRMPTLAGLRRRGYTPGSIRLFAERIGVSKSPQWVDVSTLEQALRDDAEPTVKRVMAVVDPIKVVIENYPAEAQEKCSASFHPSIEAKEREFVFSRELVIERDDFMLEPSKGFFRLSPGNEVRLRHAFIIKCERVEHNAAGQVTTLYCTYDPATKSGSGGRNVKGNIHWVSLKDGIAAKGKLYDRLFTVEDPDSGGDYESHLNADSEVERNIWIEPSIRLLPKEELVQFERVGYFIADRKLDAPQARVFNRAVDLKKAKF